MSLGIWSSVSPTASLAAILAIGKPVALDARAEERETRGFISMIITCTAKQLVQVHMLDSHEHVHPIHLRIASLDGICSTTCSYTDRR